MNGRRLLAGSAALALLSFACTHSQSRPGSDSHVAVQAQSLDSTDANLVFDIPLVSKNWTPPKTTIDPSYVKMAKALLGNGLGDPRGGKFCHVVVRAQANGWGLEDLTGYGWVVPNANTAVLSDGLEYPIKSVLSPASLDALFAKPDYEDKLCLSGLHGIDGSESTPDASPAMLLLAGRSDLAEIVFRRRPSIGNLKNSGAMLANSVFQEDYKQVAEALKMRRDALGLRWAKRLLAVAEVEQVERAGSRILNTKPFVWTNLAFARDLYHEMLRRTLAKPSNNAVTAGMDDKTRIANVVDQVDEVEGRPMHKLNPTLAYTEDSTFTDIYALGSKAVPALIDALEYDRRFARIPTAQRGLVFFDTDYVIHPVVDIIYELLLDIWPSSERWTNQDPKAMAQALRKEWPAESHLTKAEQWVEVLADDKAEPNEWLLAAEYLGLKGEHENSMLNLQPDPMDVTNVGRLKATREVEVGNLMAKRALQMVKTQKGSTDDLDTCASALLVGDYLANWSLTSSWKALAELCEVARQTVAKRTVGHPEYGQFCLGLLARVNADRIQNGDRSAIADSGKAPVPAVPTSWIRPRELKQFWLLPNDPQMRAVTGKYFGEMSKYLASSDTKTALDVDFFLVDETIESPTLTVPAYRKMLVTGCKNETKAGEAWAEYKDHFIELSYSFVNGAVGTIDSTGGEVGQAPGKQISVSVGDYLAQIVSRIDGAPHFCMIWPRQRRKEAKEKLIQWLSDDSRDWLKVAKTSPRYSGGE